MHLFLEMFSARNRRLIFAYLFLCLFSLALLWSVTEPIRGPYEDLDPGVPKSIFFRQILWVVVGCVVLTAAARLSLHYLENIAWFLYILVIVLLILVLAVGPPVGGARRWLVLGILRMQPSEMAKIAFILVSASILSRNSGEHRQLIPTLMTFVLASGSGSGISNSFMISRLDMTRILRDRSLIFSRTLSTVATISTLDSLATSPGISSPDSFNIENPTLKRGSSIAFILNLCFFS